MPDARLDDAALLAEVRQIAAILREPDDITRAEAEYGAELIPDLATRYASLLASHAALREAVARHTPMANRDAELYCTGCEWDEASDMSWDEHVQRALPPEGP